MGILNVCLKFLVSPYTMVRTHNIACRNFYSLFFNIVKRGKVVETQNCFATDSQKKSEKLSVVF